MALYALSKILISAGAAGVGSISLVLVFAGVGVGGWVRWVDEADSHQSTQPLYIPKDREKDATVDEKKYFSHI